MSIFSTQLSIRTGFLTGAVWILLAPLSGEVPGSIENAHKAHQQQVDAIRSEHDVTIGNLRDQYVGALDQLAEQVRQQGDLEQFLSLKEERETVSRGEDPGPLPEDAGSSFTELRGKYDKAASDLREERDERIRELGNIYQEFLEKTEKQLVRENRIEEALQVRGEVERLRESLPKQEEERMFDPFASSSPPPTTEPPMRLAWNPRSAAGLVEWTSRTGKQQLAITHPESHSMSPNGLQTDGRAGIEFAQEAAEPFQKAVTASGGFSLAIRVMTENLEQKGPGRILTFSRGTRLRNFTLAQHNAWLILRLRTTETGENGMSPEIALMKLSPAEPVTLVFTYSPEEGPRLFHAGKELNVQPLRGELSNWEPYSFVLGNETSGDRPWKGSVGFFELYAGTLDPKEALELSEKR